MSNVIFRLAQEIDGFHNFNEAKEFFLTTLMKRDNGYFYNTKKLQQIEENDAIYFVYDGNIVAKAKFLGEIKTNTDRDEKFIEGHKIEVLNVFDIGLKIELDLLQQKTTRSIGYINEKDTNILENIINKISKNKISNNLEVKNIILYGAPGVGKTHNYKNLISMIEEGKSQKEIFDVVSKNLHVDLKNDTYEGIKKDGRVEFVTFHQSYSYEDFIEGFRPNELGNIELENGIFKTIAINAFGKININNHLSINREIQSERSTYIIHTVTSDLIHIKKEKDNRIVPLPKKLIVELIENINTSKITLEDIKNRNFNNIDISFDKYMYGYNSIIYAICKDIILNFRT